MKSGYISLTSRCMHSCRCCPCQNKTAGGMSDLQLKDILQTVDTGRANGMTDVVLSGGEPTLHKDFFEILRILDQRGMRIGLLTTAERFSNQEFLERTLEAVPASRLRVLAALHSFKPDLHDWITRTPGSFRKTYDGLQALSRVGANLTIKHLITAPTYRDMPEFVSVFVERFSAQVRLLLCNIDFQGEAFENRAELAVKFSSSRPYLEKSLEIMIHAAEKGAWKAETRLRVRDTPLCAVSPKYWSFFHSQSNLRLAVYNDPVQQGKTPQREVSNSSGPFFRQCESCEVRNCCPGTWLSAEKVFGPDLLPEISSTNNNEG